MGVVRQALAERAHGGYSGARDETKDFDELAAAPVDALEGLSKGNAEALQKALNIKTIRDLAENKFVLRAQAIVHLAHAEKQMGQR